MVSLVSGMWYEGRCTRRGKTDVQRCQVGADTEGMGGLFISLAGLIDAWRAYDASPATSRGTEPGLADLSG